MEIELLGKEAVTQMLGICERTLENLVRRREFPPPIRLGKTARWVKSVVTTWLEEKTAAQRGWVAPQRRRRQA